MQLPKRAGSLHWPAALHKNHLARLAFRGETPVEPCSEHSSLHSDG
jgi:hypothetical protein